jgi:hypothetical protein
LIAVAFCSALAGFPRLDVATIGTRFGGVPQSPPAPALPALNLTRAQALPSAVVADGMSGRRDARTDRQISQRHCVRFVERAAERQNRRSLNGFAGKLARAKTLVGIAGARPDVERALQTAGLRRPAVIYAASVPDARRQLAAAREL